MQDMIHHHAQALVMTALLRSRSSRPEMRLLAERIDVSQKDEIALMQRWLKGYGAEVPDPQSHHAQGHGQHHPLMPGMLTEAEMMQLEKTTGTEFDRLFLQFMIRHHEGALTMVKELFSTPGTAQESQLFRFASDVDADQRAEIQRMQALLRILQ